MALILLASDMKSCTKINSHWKLFFFLSLSLCVRQKLSAHLTRGKYFKMSTKLHNLWQWFSFFFSAALYCENFSVTFFCCCCCFSLFTDLVVSSSDIEFTMLLTNEFLYWFVGSVYSYIFFLPSSDIGYPLPSIESRRRARRKIPTNKTHKFSFVCWSGNLFSQQIRWKKGQNLWELCQTVSLIS